MLKIATFAKRQTENTAKIEGVPGLNVPEGHVGVNAQYKHPSCKYGGLCGQVRQFTNQNAPEVVNSINWDKDKEAGTIGSATNSYYDEKGKDISH